MSPWSCYRNIIKWSIIWSVLKYFPSVVRELNISKTPCHEILLEDLRKRTLHARLIPCSLGQEQKENHSANFVDILETARKDDTFCPSILVEQFECTQKDKIQSGETQNLLPQRNLVPSRQKQKQCFFFFFFNLFILFYYCKGVVHKEFVLHGQTKQRCTARHTWEHST